MSSSTFTYIGIDLAWSPRNATGAAVLSGDEHGATLVDSSLLGDDAAIVEYVAAWAGEGPALVGVDAPLWVPNLTGRRAGEAELGREFARFQAGAHPANRQRLAFDGVVRGEALVASLEGHGFVHRAEVDAGARVRQIVEVFPHPAMVALFGLERTLKYKAKPNRSTETRLAEWKRYLTYIDALHDAKPALHGQESLTNQDMAALRGRRLKDFEDRVDALMCAYIVLYALRWGMTRCRVFGTMEDGYIFTPVPEAMRGST